MMPSARVIVVTGLPGAGKSTLARELSRRYRAPLAAKDLIKEPLLDVLGAADATQSRLLSDASFAALFRLARAWAANGVSCVLEGNFRPGEHEPPLLEAVASAALAQVLCRVPEAERRARLAARENDPSRHAGHRFGERLSARSALSSAVAANAAVGDRSLGIAPGSGGDAFLELPSMRIVHDGASPRTVLDELDNWMNLRAASL
jgi:predicted kinase